MNGLIRFNRKGEFNNSLHHTRKGIHPDNLAKVIMDWSSRIKNTEFRHGDYRETTKDATSRDFIYLDPPYFNTRGRYYGTIDFEQFIEYLEDLNGRGIKYALSYDGYREAKDYLAAIPDHLFKRHIYINSGNSSFQKVMNGKTEEVHESLYLNF